MLARYANNLLTNGKIQQHKTFLCSKTIYKTLLTLGQFDAQCHCKIKIFANVEILEGLLSLVKIKKKVWRRATKKKSIDKLNLLVGAFKLWQFCSIYNAHTHTKTEED